MGQRVQLHRLTKDNKWETYHHQWGYGKNMTDFFTNDQLDESFKQKKPYFIFNFDNNNGYLLLDEKNKKYAFIAGNEDWKTFYQQRKDNDPNIDKINLLFNDYYSGLESSNINHNDLRQLMNDCFINNPMTFKEYVGLFDDTSSISEDNLNIEYLKDYSLMTPKDVQEFIKKQQEELSEKESFKFRTIEDSFFSKYYQWAVIKMQELNAKEQILKNIIDNKVNLNIENHELEQKVKSFCIKLCEQKTLYCKCHNYRFEDKELGVMFEMYKTKNGFKLEILQNKGVGRWSNVSSHEFNNKELLDKYNLELQQRLENNRNKIHKLYVQEETLATELYKKYNHSQQVLPNQQLKLKMKI